MLTKIIYLLIIVMAIPFVMIAVALIQNDLPWKDEPGAFARLGRYLNHNDVSTSSDSVYPELQPRQYSIPLKELLMSLRKVVKQLNWKLQETDDGLGELHAVVTTRLFKFKDDVYITLKSKESNLTMVNIRSVSRTGKGDLGTNTRHIMDIFSALDESLK